MNRRSFLTRLAALGAGIVVVGPAWLAECQRHVPLDAIRYQRVYRRVSIDLFVDSNVGSDQASGRDVQHPLHSLQEAMSRARPGDGIYCAVPWHRDFVHAVTKSA